MTDRFCEILGKICPVINPLERVECCIKNGRVLCASGERKGINAEVL